MIVLTPWNLADNDMTSAEGPMEVSRSEIFVVGVHVVGMIKDVSLTTTRRLLAMIEPLSSPECPIYSVRKDLFRHNNKFQTVYTHFRKSQLGYKTGLG